MSNLMNSLRSFRTPSPNALIREDKFVIVVSGVALLIAALGICIVAVGIVALLS